MKSSTYHLFLLLIVLLVCTVIECCYNMSTNLTSRIWENTLPQLPQTPGKLPVFFFAHGSPLLIWTGSEIPDMPGVSIGGPDGLNANFLKYFGKFLLERYRPKAIVVFSAHWETKGSVEVMAYEKNHLYYDYYGFPPEMYRVTWESRGSSTVANRVVELLTKNNIPAKTITRSRGLDHGVFVPFKLMFPDPFQVPVVEVSMNSLDPQKLIEIGKAIAPLREEEILILSGGLSIHTFNEMNAWDPVSAPQGFKDFEQAVVDSIEKTKEGSERNKALKAVTNHPFFRRAHPREEHFVPIYVAAGAGEDGGAKVISQLHGALSFAFGL